MRHALPYLSALLLFAAACSPKVQADATKTDATPEETLEGIIIPESYGLEGFSEASELTPKGDVDVIAFGSCNKHDLPQPLWGPIMKNRPDAWVWLGDAVYGDTEDETQLRRKYDAQNANAGYLKLKGMTHVVGIWDDHDYGKNDGTKHFPAKGMSKKVYLDFVDLPDNHPARKRQGIYQAYEMGTGQRKVKIILLDNRTFRDKVARNSSKEYVPDGAADILGEAQWKWLANELKNNEAAITIIANGSQVLSRSHPYEKWANYPMARKKLFKLIGTFNPTGTILISGDRHHGEFSKVNIPDVTHPLYEVTASGMTHTRKYPRPEANKFRVGEKVDNLHFGIIRIDWEANPVKVQLELRGENDTLLESCSFDVE